MRLQADGSAFSARVLIYSHDTYGLGHLRRCRAIAHSIVAARHDASVLILSGSPAIGRFDFDPRVDFVRVPGVTKRQDGSYEPLNLPLSIEEIIEMRASLILRAAEAFQPDLFIVDKEPLGLQGEARQALNALKRRGVPLVLGLRDVLDDPAALRAEWTRKQVFPALEDLYDAIWVYGPTRFYDPLEGVGVTAAVRRKTVHTGYLRRETASGMAAAPQEPYLLVTAGGGGDGEAMIEWVLRAYESGAEGLLRAVIVTGPFLPDETRRRFAARVQRLDNVDLIDFGPGLGELRRGAAAVVAMGGYNTFCEILSFDKPALLAPREAPRREQCIRADRAQAMGLASMLPDDGQRDAA